MRMMHQMDLEEARPVAPPQPQIQILGQAREAPTQYHYPQLYPVY